MSLLESGVLNSIEGGLLLPPVVVTDATTYTVLAANSGKLHVIPDLTADIVISLPAVQDGLSYKFQSSGVAEDAQDWRIKSGSDTNYFLGGVAENDVGGTAANMIIIAPDGNSNSMVNMLTPDQGSWVEVVCDGTLWYINGMNLSSTNTPSVSFADNS